MNNPTLFLKPKRYFSLTWIVLILGLSFACDQKDLIVQDYSSEEQTNQSDMQQTSQDLYLATSTHFQKNNFVISPLSIQLTLYMVYNGADGDTKKHIGLMLHLMDTDTASGSHDLETLNKRTKNLLNYFGELVDKGHLDIHNALFYDGNRVEVAETFVERLETYFNLYKADLDFSSPAAVKSINDWVSDKTYDKIKEVMQRISDQEVLFLINALYLKADWVTGFQEQATSDRGFVTSNGDEIMIPTMHRTAGVEHVRSNGAQIVRLPLADSVLYTYLIMPEESGQLANLINSPIITKIWDDSLPFENSRAMLEVPLVETKTHLSLNEALKSLGMTSAFEAGKADLHSMGKATGGQPLYISRTLHDVYLKMDEKGVEGAAVTTIGVGTTSMPPSIQFNKPFMYLIVDHEKGLPLFIGQFTGIDVEE